MKKLLGAWIVLAAIFYALVLFLTGSVGAISVTLAPGMNDVSCPSGHRAQAAYTLDRSGLRVNCVLVASPTALPPTLAPPSPTATKTPVPVTAIPTSAPTSPPSSDPRCQNRPPLGGIEPQRPEWCFLPQAPAVTTHSNGPNSWVDDWEHGSSHGRLGNVGDGYVAGNVGGACETIHFRHNAHWMSDLISHSGQFPTLCAAWLRPDRTFTGPVVIEMEVAVPIAGTRSVSAIDDSWPELVLSTAPRPTTAQENSWGSPLRKNGTYLYEAFPRAWTFGCRLQQAKHPICALYNAGESFAGGPDRQWEINQNGGEVTDEFGGGPPAPGSARDVAWRACTSTQDPDVVCRNVFRFEITATRFKLFVNGVRFYEAGLIDSQLNNILNAPGGFYVYAGSFAYRITNNTIIRFHWDRLAVNP